MQRKKGRKGFYGGKGRDREGRGKFQASKQVFGRLEIAVAASATRSETVTFCKSCEQHEYY